MVTSVDNALGGWMLDDQGNNEAPLGHLFMPVGSTWNKSNHVVNGSITIYNSMWEEEQAVDWMSSILTSRRAWTRNIP
jgi:hypothetical protein